MFLFFINRSAHIYTNFVLQFKTIQNAVAFATRQNEDKLYLGILLKRCNFLLFTYCLSCNITFNNGFTCLNELIFSHISPILFVFAFSLIHLFVYVLSKLFWFCYSYLPTPDKISILSMNHLNLFADVINLRI